MTTTSVLFFCSKIFHFLFHLSLKFVSFGKICQENKVSIFLFFSFLDNWISKKKLIFFRWKMNLFSKLCYLILNENEMFFHHSMSLIAMMKFSKTMKQLMCLINVLFVLNGKNEIQLKNQHIFSLFEKSIPIDKNWRNYVKNEIQLKCFILQRDFKYTIYSRRKS